MKAFFKSIIVTIFGRRIIDCHSGEYLGKAIVCFWRSRIYIIGFSGEDSLLTVWLPSENLTYWKAIIGFTVTKEPDFKNVRKNS